MSPKPAAPFDFEAYLAFLGRDEHNFIRLWRWELLAWDTGANDREAPRRLVTAASVGPHRPWPGRRRPAHASTSTSSTMPISGGCGNGFSPPGESTWR